MTQMELTVSSDLPPPPKLKFSEPIHEKVYTVMVHLQPGQWLRWPKAPRGFRSLVKRWAVQASMHDVSSYRDVHGDGIVIRNVADVKVVQDDDDE